MRLSRSLPLAAALLLALSSCQTMTPEERRAADERTCRDYGFRTGTDAFAGCLLDLELDRRAQARSAQISSAQMMSRPVFIERRVIVHQKSN